MSLKLFVEPPTFWLVAEVKRRVCPRRVCGHSWRLSALKDSGAGAFFSPWVSWMLKPNYNYSVPLFGVIAKWNIMQKVFNKFVSLFWTGENPKRLPNPIESYWNWHLIGKLHDQKLVHFFRNCVLFFIAVFSYVPVDSLLTCNESNYRSISWNYGYTCYLIGHLSPRGKGEICHLEFQGQSWR